MSTDNFKYGDNFCNRLNLLIGEKWGEKSALAKSIGLTPQAITQMIKGKSNPSAHTINSIARYFKVSEEWLEYGTGEKEKYFEVTTVFVPEKKNVEHSPLAETILDVTDKLSPEGQSEALKAVMQILISEQIKAK